LKHESFGTASSRVFGRLVKYSPWRALPTDSGVLMCFGTSVHSQVSSTLRRRDFRYHPSRTAATTLILRCSAMRSGRHVAIRLGSSSSRKSYILPIQDRSPRTSWHRRPPSEHTAIEPAVHGIRDRASAGPSRGFLKICVSPDWDVPIDRWSTNLPEHRSTGTVRTLPPTTPELEIAPAMVCTSKPTARNRGSCRMR